MSDDPASKETIRWEVARGLIAALRHEWPGMGEMANEQRMRAASVIEELMATVEAWRHSALKADRDIAQLREERDGARRELCYWWELSKRQRKLKNGHKFTPAHVEWAQIFGWDCFKEDA